jgi:hypothetical protein
MIGWCLLYLFGGGILFWIIFTCVMTARWNYEKHCLRICRPFRSWFPPFEKWKGWRSYE